MLSRLIAIMVAMSFFVVIPVYAEETAAATETEAPAVAKQDKPEKVNLLDELQQAYEKNDREAMGKIIEQMQQRREKMRQKRTEFREGRKNRRMKARRGGQGQAGFKQGQSQGESRQAEFGPGQQQCYRQMGPWQGANQRWGQRNRGPGHFQRGMHGRGGWGCQKGFGWGSRARGWHHGGGRFEQGCYGWNRPRYGRGGQRFGYGEGWHKGSGRGCGGQWEQGGCGMRPHCQERRWSDTDCERETRCKQQSEWDW